MLRKLLDRLVELLYLHRMGEAQLMLAAEALAQRNSARTDVTRLHEVEFRVFSQWGDDGIVHYLTHRLAGWVGHGGQGGGSAGGHALPEAFVEFGVGDYREATTRYLLTRAHWRGLVIDRSPRHIAHIRRQNYSWHHTLHARAAHVTAENVNDLLAAEGFAGPLGLLHIDIDGMDYWVWRALTAAEPVLVVVEYNAVFGSQRPITVPYAPAFDRRRAHYSDLYFGAALPALCHLAEQRGYTCLGCNRAGNNAYFVRREWLPRLAPLRALTAAEAYVESRFRESVDARGRRSYLGGAARLEALRGLPVVNVATGLTEAL